MVERHPYTVDTGVQFSNEVPYFTGPAGNWNVLQTKYSVL